MESSAPSAPSEVLTKAGVDPNGQSSSVAPPAVAQVQINGPPAPYDGPPAVGFAPKLKNVHDNRPYCQKMAYQLQLLLRKRWCELRNRKLDIFYLTFPPLLFFSLTILIYAVIPIFFPDGLEEYIIPIGFWVFMQKVVVTIMYEKHTRLTEAMRMMGLLDSSYWLSYFISEGVIIGFVNSFLCACFSMYGLFNHANFAAIFFFLYFFFLSVVPFAFFICSFYDTPQTSGQATLLVALGLYVIFIALNIEYQPVGVQALASLVPPLALQLACCAFRRSYTGLGIVAIIGIMILDIFLYSLLAWYFSQVWETSNRVGVAKPWYFVFQPSYWLGNTGGAGVSASNRPTGDMTPTDGNGLRIALVNSTDWVGADKAQNGGGATTNPQHADIEAAGAGKPIPIEPTPEHIFGAPSVKLNKLRKSFGTQVAVNDLCLSMFENQIFALLGHNGAGKTTTINMLTGLMPPDHTIHSDAGATVYGYHLHSHMDSIRQCMGVCPQHDVLFDHLSVKETIIFFSQLKGFSYEEALEEATFLPQLFHLTGRLDHTGHELSGGQRRKLSIAVAICGGSRFIVLDEPTAGLDPLARRELWGLLSSLRQGRTILLTTHYMDEADVLGDRIGIMSLGGLQCVGSSQFLKTTFGAGYKLIFDKHTEIAFTDENLHTLVHFVQSNVPHAKHVEVDGSEGQVIFELPFESVKYFGVFFETLEQTMHTFNVSNFGVTLTSLEDVFLKVGEDHTVKPTQESGRGIGNTQQFASSMTRQVLGLMRRKLDYSRKDFTTIPLLGLPAVVGIIAAIIYGGQYITKAASTNDLIAAGIYVGGYLGAPGLLAEFVVRERAEKLRNLLTVMGCGTNAYWLGTFLGDFVLMCVPLVVIFIAWAPGHMYDYASGSGGVSFFIFILFTIHFILFSYVSSFMFTNPKYCIALMPLFVIFLIILPMLLILLFVLIFDIGLHITNIPSDVVAGSVLWGVMILSPHGALFSALLDSTFNFSSYISDFPPLGACIAFMILESVLFAGIIIYTDSLSIAKIAPIPTDMDPTFKPECLLNLDDDVAAERQAVLSGQSRVQVYIDPATGRQITMQQPLRIERLRKVFPPKRKDGPAVVATEDVCFGVQSGEIFGLLGANGAGKTTTLSMLTRALVPSAGDAHVAGESVLSGFDLAARHLGVVTQNNALWGVLSVEDHLYLFARLRGVPTALVKQVVDATIDQLELTPHRFKQAKSLSGGMKRKLCVAIALIGDPEVVLLDEPSAGLDPVSRRNLWSVILRTMSHRAVVLTTHSMEEAEALCHRIGIMVKGQLRALGTKQHLKNKFGSGYELVTKLQTNSGRSNFVQETMRISAFVTNLFPGARLIGENGGLLTFQIPKEQMRMSVAFTQMEANKAALGVEDYSVAQPTLEQVFIRTVVAHSADVGTASTNPVLRDSLSTPNDPTIGGRASIHLDENGNLITSLGPSTMNDNDQLGLEFKAPVNICGCTYFVVQCCIGVATFFTLLFLGIAFGTGSSICFGLGVIALVTAIVFCNIYCCPCCQPTKGADE